MIGQLAPVAIFCYKKVDELKRSIDYLLRNKYAKDSEIYFFSDGFKGSNDKDEVLEVRKFLKTVSGFKKVQVIERESNYGLSKNVISGVGQVLGIEDRVIVLEDDMLTSSTFLEFINTGLELYKNDLNVASVHGYVYNIPDLPDTFFLKGADCFGWGCWKRSWDCFEEDGASLMNEIKKRNLEDEFDFSGTFGYMRMLRNQILGNNDSWAVRWYASAFLKNMYTLYPGKSLIRNIGFSKNATNTNGTVWFDTPLSDFKISGKIPVEEDRDVKEKFVSFFKKVKIKKRKHAIIILKNKLIEKFTKGFTS